MSKAGQVCIHNRANRFGLTFNLASSKMSVKLFVSVMLDCFFSIIRAFLLPSSTT